MPRTIAVALGVLLIAAGPALAQSTPVDNGPPGTPITPPQLGNWTFAPGIGEDEAAQDARAQGFVPVTGLRQDDYGNWIGNSRKGAFIIFPDGHAFPL
jgi:hypothetical protein